MFSYLTKAAGEAREAEFPCMFLGTQKVNNYLPPTLLFMSLLRI